MTIQLDPFATYQQYLALKLHFTTDSYDYIKYNGKTSAKFAAFEKRKDKHFFGRLSKRNDSKYVMNYFVANLIAGKEWIGEMDKKILQEWLSRTQSIEYNFTNDIEKLLTNVSNFDIIFTCEDGTHPKLIKTYLGKKISLETLVILEKILHYRKHFDKKIQEKFMWPDISRLILKYEPFVKADIYKCKSLLREKVGV